MITKRWRLESKHLDGGGMRTEAPQVWRSGPDQTSRSVSAPGSSLTQALLDERLDLPYVMMGWRWRCTLCETDGLLDCAQGDFSDRSVTSCRPQHSQMTISCLVNTLRSSTAVAMCAGQSICRASPRRVFRRVGASACLNDDSDP
jgi:hypothetical protein